MRRIVSLWLPLFPVEQLMRARQKAGEPLLPPEAPFALVTAGAKGMRLAAINRVAQRLGLMPGDRLADARARVPDLLSEIHDAKKDEAALLGLARWAERWSPSIMVDKPDGITLDATGIPHLFGGEAPFLDTIRDRLSELGLTVRLALAGNPAATRGLSRFATREGAPVIVPEGGERTALARLPVAALGLSADTVTTLKRLGLKRILDLYPLPRSALARRFRDSTLSGEVLQKLDAALGLTKTPLVPLDPPPRFAVRQSLDEPAITAEVVAFLLRRMTKQLSGQLAQQGCGSTRLTLKLYRVDGSRVAVQAGLASPSTDSEHMARLLEPKLEGTDLGFGIEAATLEASETAAVEPLQTSLAEAGGSPLRDGTALAALADRIANRDDGARLSAFLPVASHLPERAERPVSPFRKERSPAPAIPPDLPRPLLLLAPPEPIAVIAAVPDGPPMHFTWRRAPHRVMKADGPERIDSEWWRALQKAGPARDYYLVEDEIGRRYWLYRQGLYQEAETPPAWFIHGLFP
jgi:protein ImuB